MAEIIEVVDASPLNVEKPTAIVAHTVKGKGVSFAENTYLWHSNNVNDEIYAKAIAELAP
jgi:transketolase